MHNIQITYIEFSNYIINTYSGLSRLFICHRTPCKVMVLREHIHCEPELKKAYSNSQIGMAT